MKKTLLLLALILFLVACDTPVEPTPTAVPPTDAPASEDAPPTAESTDQSEADQPVADESMADQIVISEIMVASSDDNNHEFIELYNPMATAVDLRGWSLWYNQRADQEPQRIFLWSVASDIPPFGHYLLVREGQDFGLMADDIFQQPLSEKKGGFILRNADGEDVDIVGYGEEAPDGVFAGTPAILPEKGVSIERLPGGDDGNMIQTSDNVNDFAANPAPNPQNSGSPVTPASEQKLSLTLQLPETVQPGLEFDYEVSVENVGEEIAQATAVTLNIPDHFTILNMPDGAEVSNGRVTWTMGDIDPGAIASSAITVQAPLTYVDTIVRGYYAETEGAPRTYGPIQFLPMGGGSIPIATARELEGQIVSVEGVATMYTDGYFAGSTGTKFYMEDETGGIQVYIPGGLGLVSADIGDLVRVTGEIELYRDSIEIIPVEIPDDVEILGQADVDPSPMLITAEQNENDPTVWGRLVTVEGTATRLEEFTYSYEMDLMDDTGNITEIYFDKEANITAEPYDVGERYTVTGISEFYSGQKQVKPRLQSDVVQIFPPIVMLEQSGPSSAQAGEVVTYTITVYNHTPDMLTDVQISTTDPRMGATVADILDNGVIFDDLIIWLVGDLEGNGGSATVQYTAVINDNAEMVETAVADVIAEDWSGNDRIQVESYRTFVGTGVPIWAIQGTGDRSPYVRTEATTEGIVTGVFPELNGFFIQEAVSDDDPTTSAGLFVTLDGEAPELPVAVGDLVQVTGRIRELSGQTVINPASTEQIVVVSSETPLPATTVWDPPQLAAEALPYNESLEGMLVTLGETAVAIAPTTRYGEYALVYEKWGVDELPRGAENGFIMMVDDGSMVAHEDGSTLPYGIAKGDQVTNLTGPLAYTFGNYKIEPVADPDVVESERPLASFPEMEPNQFTIATFNVENMFDRFDPHPSNPPKPGKIAYEAKLNKIADVIVALGAPTILGLQEVENLAILEDLVALEQLAPYSYQPYLVEGIDSRGIDVAYLVRGDQVTVHGVDNYPEPTGLTSRPPLVMTATIQLENGASTDVYVLNNHFTSLSAGEEATEPIRNGQAAWNVTLMEQIRATDPDAQFIVMGDLNSFWQTLPLDTLAESGLQHVYEFVEEGEPIPYTYIFEGATQSLDHILVSPELFERLIFVDALHINADYPMPLPDDPSPNRVSDHDPLLAVFTLNED